MNIRKLLLADIRQGNYAHAGETEAIDIAMSLLQMPQLKNGNNRTILDVGSGLGGTADYFQNKGFGKVIGIDIDETVVSDAKRLYPAIDFYLCDAHQANQFFTEIKFDIIYSFNAFFCFKDQRGCLKSLYDVAQDNAELLIFDYSCLGSFVGNNPFVDNGHKSTAASNFHPIDLSKIDALLAKAGWKLNKVVNLDAEYKRWYDGLILKMDRMKDDLISKYNEKTFHDIYQGFIRLMVLLEQKSVGGSIVHAYAS